MYRKHISEGLEHRRCSVISWHFAYYNLEWVCELELFLLSKISKIICMKDKLIIMLDNENSVLMINIEFSPYDQQTFGEPQDSAGAELDNNGTKMRNTWSLDSKSGLDGEVTISPNNSNITWGLLRETSTVFLPPVSQKVFIRTSCQRCQTVLKNTWGLCWNENIYLHF